VVTEHAAPFSFHLEQGAFWRSAAEWTVQNADVTVAVSEGLRRQMSEAVGADVVVAGNAFDADFFSPSVQPRPAGLFRFAAVAILTPRKGIDVLLQACRQVLDSGVSEWELVIAGEGQARAELERLTDHLRLRDHVRFAGRLERVGVRDLLRSADAFVLASHHENLPGVIAEAMLTDLPVIATRCGGPEYMVPEGLGRLVPVGDHAALARAMSDAIRGGIGGKPGDARALAVAEYGREAFLRRIEGIYERAASSRAASSRARLPNRRR
jgi:glycosyltransferase involved in cell wall biosynthesis